MRKFVISFMAATVMAVGGVGLLPEKADAVISQEDIQEVQLTEEQQKELANLYQDLLDTKEEVINKYVEYDVFTEEKGEQIVTHMKRHYEMLEENNFIPNWEKFKKHKEES